jgi:hypothetical protein
MWIRGKRDASLPTEGIWDRTNLPLGNDPSICSLSEMVDADTHPPWPITALKSLQTETSPSSLPSLFPWSTASFRGFWSILSHSRWKTHCKPSVERLSQGCSLIMGQRMGGQKVLCLKQGDQGSQGGLVREVLLPRCVLLKPSPPILLPLTTHSPKPLSQRNLLEEA